MTALLERSKKEENQLEVYRDPKNGRYQTSFTLQVGQMATCLAFPNDPVDWFSSLGGKK